MLLCPVPTICILVKDYYDIDKIESMKAKIAKLPDFRFFISSQYTDEPKYDIYVVAGDPEKMIENIEQTNDLIQYIDIITVNKV